ncbi:MAG: hypothetical protein KKC01_11515 [Gammaproteobacteria bacterium]|nr:hypothetical protein [Gammaproteobacteria bacterium]
MNLRLTHILLLLSLLLLTACGGDKAVRPEDRPAVPRSIVIGMTADAVQLSAFENIFANILRTEGEVVCLIATGLPDLSAGITMETLNQAAEAAHVDAVIINRMVSESARGGDAGGLTEYLDQITPVRRVEEARGLIESRAFDITSGALLWSGWSDAVNPRGRLQDLAKESTRVAEKLAKSRVLFQQQE